MYNKNMIHNYSQYSTEELYRLLRQEIMAEKRELILNELSKRLKISLEETVSEISSKPPVISEPEKKDTPPPTGTNGGNDRTIVIIFWAIIIGIVMLMAGL